MTYDFHGAWDARTNFNAALYDRPGETPPLSVDTAVKTYLAAQVPASKIVVGMPLYGRGYAGVGADKSGLDQPFSGLPPGSWEPGIFDYKDIELNQLSGAIRYWDDAAKVPWLYNSTTKVMISYDDPESIGMKAQYVHDRRLGGGMFWELSGDDVQSSLVEALRSRL
jgi:chitinase